MLAGATDCATADETEMLLARTPASSITFTLEITLELNIVGFSSSCWGSTSPNRADILVWMPALLGFDLASSR